MATKSKSPQVWILLLALLAPGLAPAATVELELVSRRAYSAGDPGNGASRVADVSPDGRYLLLSTRATNLVAGFDDDNGVEDLVVIDQMSGERDWITVSVSRPGHSAVAGSAEISGRISSDGRYVAYSSLSRDLVAGLSYPDSAVNVYLFDRQTRVATLVSHQAGAATTTAVGRLSEISGDGRWVLYAGDDASSLVAGATDTNETQDYFLFDRQSGESILVGGAAGSPAVASSRGIAQAYGLSDDGRWVLFVSHSGDLLAGFTDNNGESQFDAYLFDRDTATTTLITHAVGSATAGAAGSMQDIDPPAVYLNMTPDAAYVAFTHRGNNLIAGASGPGSFLQAYRWQRSSGSNQLISGVNGSPTQRGNERSRPNAISADGRYVVLQSWSTDLYPGLLVPFPGSGPGLYRVDLAGPALTLINHPAAWPNIVSCCLATGRGISADGRYVLFDGSASSMVAGQTGYDSAFLYDHSSGATQMLAHVPGQPTAALLARGRGLSSDGRFSQLESTYDLAGATGAAVGDNTFVFDRSSGALTRSSTTTTAGVTAGQVRTESIELAGGDLVFHTRDTGLLPGFTDTNQENDPLLFLAATSSFSPLVHAAGAPGQAPNGRSRAAFLPGGQAFLLVTSATDLASGIGDTNNGPDVFLGQRGSATYHLASSQQGQPATTADGAVWGGMRGTPAGSYVAFDTLATNATPATDTNGEPDVVRWTFGSAGGGQLISHAAGDPGNSAAGTSHLMGLSADGGKLLFTSSAGNVTAPFVDHNGLSPDLYLWGQGGSVLLTGQGALPGHGSAGSPGDSRLADDGSVVIFEHTGNDLIPGLTDGAGSDDIFAFDTASGVLSLEVHALGQPTTTPNAGSRLFEIAANGRFVLFDSRAGNLVPPAENQDDDNCFLLDRKLDRVFLISHPAGDPAAKAGGISQALSPNGRYVIFASSAEGLVPGQLPSADTWPPYNLFLHDRATGERLLLTHVPGEHLRPGNRGFPFEVVLAGDGSSVAFITTQSGLVAGDSGGDDLFFGRIDWGGLLFSDGFEMGDSSLWSATVGEN